MGKHQLRLPPQCGEAPFRQGEPAEEHASIKEVSGERVPEERDSRHIAGDEALYGPRIEVTQAPHAEVRDDEEQHRPSQRGPAHDKRRAPIPDQPAEDHVEGEAAVDERHQSMDAEAEEEEY